MACANLSKYLTFSGPQFLVYEKEKVVPWYPLVRMLQCMDIMHSNKQLQGTGVSVLSSGTSPRRDPGQGHSECLKGQLWKGGGKARRVLCLIKNHQFIYVFNSIYYTLYSYIYMYIFVTQINIMLYY